MLGLPQLVVGGGWGYNGVDGRLIRRNAAPAWAHVIFQGLFRHRGVSRLSLS